MINDSSRSASLDRWISERRSPSFRRSLAVGWLGLLLLCGAGLRAENVAKEPDNPGESPRILSLAEARKIAFQSNWDLLAAKANIDLALAQLMVAREFPNPTLSYTTSTIGTRSNSIAGPHGNTLYNRSYDTIFAINQLVEVAGKRKDRQDSAKAGILGARARFVDARRTLDQGVTKAFLAVLLAEENAIILRESARTLQRESAIAVERIKVGDISLADKNLIDNNAALFVLQANAAMALAQQARVALDVLLGVKNARGHWRPKEALEALLGPPHFPPNPGGVAVRPDVLAAQEDLESALAQLRLQKAYRIPDPTFSLQYEHNPLPSAPPAPDTFGVGVSLPLPILNQNKGNIRAAEATVSGYVMALGKVKTQVTADIATALSEYDEASDRLHRYQSEIVPKSAKILAAINLAYDKGGARLLDLLSAIRDHNTNRQGMAQSQADTAGAAADLTAARELVDPASLPSTLATHR